MGGSVGKALGTEGFVGENQGAFMGIPVGMGLGVGGIPGALGGAAFDARDRARKNAQAGRNNLPPRPDDPSFNSRIDPATGLLKSQYQLQMPENVTADQRAISALRENALSQGPSRWAQQMTDQQRLEQLQQGSSLDKNLATSQANQRAAMASKGGLGAGQSSRLAQAALRAGMAGRQGISREGVNARLGIGIQDEQMKQENLRALPQMDLAMAGLQERNVNRGTEAQKYNLGATTDELNNQRDFDQSMWKTKLGEYAAGQDAQAMRDRAEKKGAFGLGVFGL